MTLLTDRSRTREDQADERTDDQPADVRLPRHLHCVERTTERAAESTASAERPEVDPDDDRDAA